MVTVIEGQVNFTAASDARFKRNINSNVPGLDFISRLNPVTYTWDIDAFCWHTGESLVENLAANRAEASAIVYTGFLAQEFEAAANEIGYNFSGVVSPKNEHDNYGLRYAEFTVPLVKAVQEQQKMIEDQNAIIAQQSLRLETLEKQIQQLLSKDN
jgi:trimeric autotransporter adhesin